MKTAWKELVYHKKRYLLIGLIVTLLLFMVLFLSGLVTGLGRAVSSGIENIPGKTFILTDTSENLITVSNFEKAQSDLIRKDITGEVTSLDIQRMYLTKENDETKMDVVFFAIENNSFIAPNLIENGGKATFIDKHQILLDDDFISEGIKVGDKVVDPSTKTSFTVMGFTKDQMYGHVSIGFISHEDFVELRTKLNPNYKETVSALVAKDEVKIDKKGAISVSKENVIKDIPGFAQEQTTISMVKWLLVIITAVIISIFYYVLTIQKEREYGVMKAIGIPMSKIMSIIFWQVFFVAAIGTVIANILVKLMSMVLPGTMPFYLETKSIVIVSVVFILVSVVGALFSIIRVSKIDPVSVIGGEE